MYVARARQQTAGREKVREEGMAHATPPTPQEEPSADGGRHPISRRVPVCYPVGVGIEQRPTRTRPVRTVSTEGTLG